MPLTQRFIFLFFILRRGKKLRAKYVFSGDVYFIDCHDNVKKNNKSSKIWTVGREKNADAMLYNLLNDYAERIFYKLKNDLCCNWLSTKGLKLHAYMLCLFSAL